MRVLNAFGLLKLKQMNLLFLVQSHESHESVTKLPLSYSVNSVYSVVQIHFKVFF